MGYIISGGILFVLGILFVFINTDDDKDSSLLVFFGTILLVVGLLLGMTQYTT